jgi:nucleosome assembly protein 1-like 1
MSDLGASLPPGGAAALSPADRAGLVNVLKDKLSYLAGQSSGYIDNLPKMVKRRVKVLQELQSQHDELEAKFHEERAALEAKYQKLYEPLYIKRSEIVNGVVEVEAPKDEGRIVEVDASKDEDVTPAEGEKEEDQKGVPEFWLTAMKTNEIVGMQITERDEAALKFIKDIKSSNLEDNKGFKLDFYFEENPYFKNTVLSKTYHMIDDDEPILERAVGTEIEWAAGKNLTQKVMKKKPKKGAKNTKPVTKTEQCESFFNFFTPPQVPEDDDIDQDTAEALQDSMEQDYDVGSTIRDKIIPHAVSWFTGDALNGEEFEDDDDEGDEDDEDDEDDDEEDDDEEDDDDEDEENDAPAPKGRAPKAAGGPQQSGEQPPECKQQ